jgi:hypothetical protein
LKCSRSVGHSRWEVSRAFRKAGSTLGNNRDTVVSDGGCRCRNGLDISVRNGSWALDILRLGKPTTKINLLFLMDILTEEAAADGLYKGAATGIGSRNGAERSSTTGIASYASKSMS